jgi:hypothetical protein
MLSLAKVAIIKELIAHITLYLEAKSELTKRVRIQENLISNANRTTRKVLLTSGLHHCKLGKNRIQESALIIRVECIVSGIFAVKIQRSCRKKEPMLTNCQPTGY